MSMILLQITLRGICMNEGEHSKITIHTSWLFEAIASQYRSLFNEIKIYSSSMFFKNSKMFLNFTTNLKISSMLLGQAKNSFNNVIKNGTFSSKHLSNIYAMYLKRSIYQVRKAQDLLSNLRYDSNIVGTNEYKSLCLKMQNLLNFYRQIDANFYTMQNF